MQFSDYIQTYITEPDNIYDLVGNCFGLLCENIKDPSAFISDYMSEGEIENPNLAFLKCFSEEIKNETVSFQPSHYDEYIWYIKNHLINLRLYEYLDSKLNELTVVYSILPGIDAEARGWDVHKFYSNRGPLDRINKTGYRVYYSSHDTLHFDYTENVGRDGKYANDFSSEFEIFRFINTRKWKVQ